MGKDSKLGIEGYWILGVFIFALFSFLSCEAKADVRVEIGSTLLSSETSKGGALILSERFADKYEIGFGYVSKQECRCNFPADLKENIFLQGQRVTSLGNWELGIGMAYWQNTNRSLGEPFTFSLSVGYNINDTFSLRFRHWSNAGSGAPNLGQDLLTIGYRF